MTEWRHVKLGKVLGKGQFGEVHQGMITWQGVPRARREQFDRGSLIPVTIKMVKGTRQNKLHSCNVNSVTLILLCFYSISDSPR